MKYATFDGRLQRLTRGIIDDLSLTYNLACNPDCGLDNSLIVYKDGRHTTARARAEELGVLGNLDCMIIGLAGADPSFIGPEEIRADWEKSAETFFNPEKNKLTYFQRLVLVKQLLILKGLPIEQIDIIPKFPHHYYPSLEGLFEDADSRQFQYLGVENDHHFKRIQTKSPSDRNIVVFYHDYRKIPKEEKAKRDEPLVTADMIRGIDNKQYLLLVDEPEKDTLPYHFRNERVLDRILLDSEKKGNEAVLVITHPYTPCEMKMCRLSPFYKYQHVKNKLLGKGVDLSKVHVTFLLHDPVSQEINLLRQKWCLPTNYVLYPL